MNNMDSPLPHDTTENNIKSPESSQQVTLEFPTSEEYRALYSEVYSELSEHRDFIVGSLKHKYQSSLDEEIYSDYVKSITDHFKKCPGCSEKAVIAGDDWFMSDVKGLLEKIEEEQKHTSNLKREMLEKKVDTDHVTIDDFIKEYYWYHFRALVGRFGDFLHCPDVHQKAHFIASILNMSDVLQDHQKIIHCLEEYGND